MGSLQGSALGTGIQGEAGGLGSLQGGALGTGTQDGSGSTGDTGVTVGTADTDGKGTGDTEDTGDTEGKGAGDIPGMATVATTKELGALDFR